MNPRLKFQPGRGGRGVRLTVDRAFGRQALDVGISYMDAAMALFDLKEFLQASDTGRRCIDEVHRTRQGVEHGT